MREWTNLKNNLGIFSYTIVAVLIAVSLTLFLPNPSLAEGDYLVRLEQKSTSAEDGSDKIQVEYLMKRTVIMESFLKANRKLEREEAWEYSGYVMEASKLFGVDPFLIASMIIKESTVNKNARSKYAYGLMQINWRVHKKGLKAAFKQIRSLQDLLLPRNNILAGTYIFSWYMKSSSYDVKKALGRYLGRNGSKYINGVLGLCNKMSNNYQLAMTKQNIEGAGS
jgi:soluble lytic murein transglycosylase-like protein